MSFQNKLYSENITNTWRPSTFTLGVHNSFLGVSEKLWNIKAISEPSYDTSLFHSFIGLLSCDKHKTIGLQFNICKKTNCKWSSLIHKMEWKKFIVAMIIWVCVQLHLICNASNFVGKEKFEKVRSITIHCPLWAQQLTCIYPSRVA